MVKVSYKDANGITHTRYYTLEDVGYFEPKEQTKETKSISHTHKPQE